MEKYKDNRIRIKQYDGQQVVKAKNTKSGEKRVNRKARRTNKYENEKEGKLKQSYLTPKEVESFVEQPWQAVRDQQMWCIVASFIR